MKESSYIFLVFLIIAINGMEPSKSYENPCIITGLRYVLQTLVTPPGVTNTRFSPHRIQQKLFEQLDSASEDYSVKELPGSYPPIIKSWLVNQTTTAKVREQAQKKINFFRHPFLYYAAEQAFTPEKSAQAFKTHTSTCNLLKQCQQKASLILCTNLNTELYHALINTSSTVFALFKEHHISGQNGVLTTDPVCFTPILRQYSATSCFFIDYEEETCIAANQAGIPQNNILHYDCTHHDAPASLHNFLSLHNLLPETSASK